MLGYSVQMMKWRDSGTTVKFTGPCASACTIYLALPRDQICITRGATFGFHGPYSATPDASRIAQAYLLEHYPEWVKTWIVGRGGLSGEIITMDYAYASKFLMRCDQLFA